MNKFTCASKCFFLLAILFLPSCEKRSFVSQEFSFPAEIKPHEVGWDYRISIKFSLKENWTGKNEKTIEVIAIDSSGKTALLDRFTLVAGPIKAKVIWNKDSVLRIVFFEEGNPYLPDEYNSFLLKRGPIKLKEQIYNPVRAFSQ